MLGNFPIRTKLNVIIMVTCIVALLLAGIGFVLLDRHTLKQAMVQEISVLAQVVASRSTAALTFDDQDLAQENLEALKVKASIVEACMRREGKPFACYARPGRTCCVLTQENPLSEGYTFSSDLFHFTQPIVLDGFEIGRLHITTNLEELHARLRHQIMMGGAILLLASLLALFLSTRLQRFISRPIAELSRTAADITNNKNYGLRAADPESRDEIGHFVQTFNIMLDQIEEHDAALRKSELHFRQLIEASPVAMCVVGPDEAILYINKNFLELFGYTLDDIPTVGEWWPRAYPDEEYRRFVKAEWQQRVEKAMEESIEIVPQETKVTCKDGSVRHIHFRGAPLGDRMVVVFTDITERIEAEEEKIRLVSQLRQAQKMEAIGTLAGGIAHDFNNILAAIIGYTELALMEDPGKDTFREDLAEVLKAGNRAKELVQQILIFSRARGQSVGLVEVAPLVRESLKLLRASIPTTVEIRDHIETDASPVLSDPTSIHQLVMNLCGNASQAMEENGGVLEVRLDQVAIAGDSELPAGDFVHLSVIDTGTGMDDVTMERIFDPYFTTKEMGRGTGMGLSVVHGILEKLGGKITVKSQVGKGSNFEVFLPVAEGVAEDLESKSDTTIRGGTERILLVDDEETLVDFGRRLLTELGYQVTAVTDSREAQQIFLDDPQAFDLVITDQTMPHLAGSELARSLLEARSDIPIVLCTGYSSTMTEGQAMEAGIRAFAMKPLNRQSLARIVREVLNGGEAQPARPSV